MRGTRTTICSSTGNPFFKRRRKWRVKKTDTKKCNQLLTFIVKFFKRSTNFLPFSSTIDGNQETFPYLLNNIRKKPNCFSYVAKRINFEKNSPVKKKHKYCRKNPLFQKPIYEGTRAQISRKNIKSPFWKLRTIRILKHG